MNSDDRSSQTQESDSTSTPPSLNNDAKSDVKIANVSIWKSFFSLTGGSVFYCLSALSIIYGIAKILGPLLAKANMIGEAMPCLIALNSYEIALMGVLLLIVLWQSVTDDAVSLVVLVALFASGSGLALSTVSIGSYGIAIKAGAVCLIAGLIKIYLLRRYIRMSIGWLTLGGLVTLFSWVFLSGALSSGAMPGIESETLKNNYWMNGWLALLSGSFIVTLGAFRKSPPLTGDLPSSVPFIRKPEMVWIFACIILVCAGIHQHVLAYIYDVNDRLGDYMPLFMLVFFLLAWLACNLKEQIKYLPEFLTAIPLLVNALALATDTTTLSHVQWIYGLWHQPVMMGIGAATCLYMSLRAKRGVMLTMVMLYTLTALLTIGHNPLMHQHLHWHMVMSILAIGLFCIGLIRQRIALCAISMVIMVLGVFSMQWFQNIVHSLPSTQADSLRFGLWPYSGLLLALLFGSKMPRIYVIISAVIFALIVLNIFPTKCASADIVIAGIVAVTAALLWYRTGRWAESAVLCLPFINVLLLLLSRFPAWKYVVLSFILLFLGAAVSVYKGKKSVRKKE